MSFDASLDLPFALATSARTHLSDAFLSRLSCQVLSFVAMILVNPPTFLSPSQRART